MNKTFSLKASEIEKSWYVIDATDLVVGRLASIIAKRLRGKHKPTFTPHMDCGDYIIVTNARKVHFTGNKSNRKDGHKYYRHTGHPGGIKEVTAGKLLEGRFPERVLMKAVERMITRNNLGRKQMTHLFIYSDGEHPHTAQQPEVLDIKAMNAKNSKRNVK